MAVDQSETRHHSVRPSSGSETVVLARVEVTPPRPAVRFVASLRRRLQRRPRLRLSFRLLPEEVSAESSLGDHGRGGGGRETSTKDEAQIQAHRPPRRVPRRPQRSRQVLSSSFSLYLSLTFFLVDAIGVLTDPNRCVETKRGVWHSGVDRFPPPPFTGQEHLRLRERADARLVPSPTLKLPCLPNQFTVLSLHWIFMHRMPT